jgi:hypothetical protein
MTWRVCFISCRNNKRILAFLLEILLSTFIIHNFIFLRSRLRLIDFRSPFAAITFSFMKSGSCIFDRLRLSYSMMQRPNALALFSNRQTPLSQLHCKSNPSCSLQYLISIFIFIRLRYFVFVFVCCMVTRTFSCTITFTILMSKID